jgi:hypothetical protein
VSGPQFGVRTVRIGLASGDENPERLLNDGPHGEGPGESGDQR